MPRVTFVTPSRHISVQYQFSNPYPDYQDAAWLRALRCFPKLFEIYYLPVSLTGSIICITNVG